MVSLSIKYGRFIFMDSGGVPESVTKEDYERLTEVSRKLRRRTRTRLRLVSGQTLPFFYKPTHPHSVHSTVSCQPFATR